MCTADAMLNRCRRATDGLHDLRLHRDRVAPFVVRPRGVRSSSGHVEQLETGGLQPPGSATAEFLDKQDRY
jgi:hypothetical protein